MDNYAATNLNTASLASPAKPKRGRPPKNQSLILHGGIKKPFECQYCPRSFGRKSDMARHTHVHTGTRPHRCTFPKCGKEFIQTSALTVHTRVHTGEKPHCCPEDGCDKRFSDSSSLARHRKIHKKPFQCVIGTCSKGATTWDKLHDHVVKNHKAVEAVTQDYATLCQVPTIFRYRKTSDGRTFAIPLRIVHRPPGMLELIVDMENCQDQNLQQGEWAYKEDSTVSQPPLQESAPDTYPMQCQGSYNGLGSSGIVTSSGHVSGVVAEWQNHGSMATASMAGQFHDAGNQTSPVQVAFSPPVSYSLATHDTILSFGPMPAQTSMALYPPMSNPAVPQVAPTSHSLSIQQAFPVGGSVIAPFNHGLTRSFEPGLAQGSPIGTEFSDQRRISSSTESTYYPDQPEFSHRDIQDLGESQTYSGQYQGFANGIHHYAQDIESYESVSIPNDDGSQSPVPELTGSEAQSPSEVDGGNNVLVYFDNFGIKEEPDTNGFPLPGQYYTS